MHERGGNVDVIAQGEHVGAPLWGIEVVFVLVPVLGIVGDVFSDEVQGVFVADYVFVVGALPKFPLESGPPGLLYASDIFVRGHRLEPLYHARKITP